MEREENIHEYHCGKNVDSEQNVDNKNSNALCHYARA